MAPGCREAAEELAAKLGIAPLLARCLVNRGLSEVSAAGLFLQPRLKHLRDPFLLPGMAAAVERLIRAHAQRETVIIFGDYDVDGVTATALVHELLRRLGFEVRTYLPNRMDEGYGLSQDAVENCLARHAGTVLLAVDCGSTTVESVRWLGARGVDVIVVDHHQVSDPAPPACALVNPQLGAAAAGTPPQAGAGFRELCSVGLAFKLAHALVKRGRELGWPGAAEFDLRPLLDLVALGTIADVVPLSGENRILVWAGLERLAGTQRPGLRALKEVAQCPSAPGVHEVGFQLAPRLNAAGRLESAEDALRLLLAPTGAEALALARQLDARNRERQQIERVIADEALGLVRARFNPAEDLAIVEGQDSWHIGVVGIVAARVLQQFYRPTVIVGGDGELLRGSGRSIAGFDLAAALRECADLLERHGGHAMAAGLSLRRQNLEAFRARLSRIAGERLSPQLLQRELRLDGDVGPDELTLDCLSALERMKPIGQGNAAPQFCLRGVTHARPAQRMGADKQHVKMWVGDGRVSHEAVWWGAGNSALPDGRFDIAFAPQINEFRGQRSVQLKVLDWRPAVGV